jgi:hypothetical protein
MTRDDVTAGVLGALFCGGLALASSLSPSVTCGWFVFGFAAGVVVGMP